MIYEILLIGLDFFAGVILERIRKEAEKQMKDIWQDIRVCGNRIYLVLIYGEFGSIIRFTAETLLEEEIWRRRGG